MAPWIKNLTAKMLEICVRFLSQEDPLKEGMASCLKYQSHGQRSLKDYSP